MVLGAARYFGVAVAGQVDQQAADFVDFGFILAMLPDMGAADGKVIDMLGAARGFRGKGQFFLVAQDVDRGRFAGVGAAGEGYFRDLCIWQIAQMIDRGEEAGLPKLGHRLGILVGGNQCAQA